MPVVYIPTEDGDRPVLVEVFPTAPTAPTGVTVTVINKVTDATVATTAGTATVSAQDAALWFYDTADITGVNLESVSFAQLILRLRAAFSGGGQIDRYQELIVNGARSNLDNSIGEVNTNVLGVEADTMDIQSRLPAALVGGRMDSDVAVIQNDVITAAVIATDAIGAAEIAADAIGSSELATTAVNEIRDSILADSTAFNGADVATILADTNDIQTRLPAALVGGKMDSDMTAVSGDTTAADNIEATYDGTGYEDAVAPAQQQQLDQIAITGAAINQSSNSDSTLTTGTTISGDYTDTAALDGTYWQIEDAAGTLDMYFEFLISSDGVPTTVTHTGRVNGVLDDLNVFAWDWDGASWTQIGTLTGQATTTDAANTFTLFTANVGTGADQGKVRIRFQNTGLTSSDFYTDQIFVSYAVVNRSVGYADGAIWIDTINGTAGTTSFINGTADNPVDTLADALTLSSQLNLNRFRVASGSSIAFLASKTNDTFIGDNWTLALGGQNISGTAITGAIISGTATGADYIMRHCQVGTCTLANGTLAGCSLTDTLTLSAADAYFLDSCYSGVAGTGSPTIDMGAAVGNTQLNMRHYSGGVEVENMGQSGTDNMSLEGEGQLIINANCTGGTIAVRGEFNLTDNSGGAVTLSDDARLTRSEIVDDIWDEAIAGHSGAGSAGLELQNKAEPGDAMDLVTDAVDSDSVSTTGANEIRDAILSDSTPFAGANIDATISSRSSHSAADVDTTLTASHGAGSWQTATGFSTHSAADAADAVWDEAKAGHVGAGSFGEEVQSHSIPGDAMDLISDAVDATSLATSAVNEISADVDTVLSASHGAGSWEGGGSAADIADAVWDEATAGHVGAGSFGLELQNKAEPGDEMALEDDAITSSKLAASASEEIADQVWDEAIAGHSGVGTAGLELQNKSEPGDQMDLVANAVDTTSLADNTITAAKLVTDCITSDEIATSAANEIRDAILSDSTAFAGANIDAAISSRSSHSAADVDTTLTASHGAGNWTTATGFSTHSAADVWDEAVGAQAAGTAGERLGTTDDRVDVTLSTRSSHDAADVDTTLTASHGAGAWTSSVPPTVGAIADAVWTELLSDHETALNGTETAANTLALLRKILNNRLELADGSSSNWVLYDDDDSTTLRTYDVTNNSGGAISQATSAPARRTRGT